MNREEGGFITKTLFSILILGLLIYAAINLGTPWFKYYSFNDRLNEIALYEASSTMQNIRKDVMEAVEDKAVPIEEKDIIIEQKDRKLRIKAEWDHEVSLFGGNITHVFHFSIDTGKE